MVVMQALPVRLKAKRVALIDPAMVPGEGKVWSDFLPDTGVVMGNLRVVRRGVAVALWTLLSLVVQSVLIRLPGRAKIAFARRYWAGVARLIGLQVCLVGTPATVASTGGRPVLFVSNHSSWLDIPVLGGRLEACFVSKDDVIGWPVIGLIARLGRTVYVRRRRASVERERDDMQARLRGGDSLILFPEGTTSDGSRVMPFRSAFLSVALLPVTPGGLPAITEGGLPPITQGGLPPITEGGLPPIIQPVSVVYDRLGGLPTGRLCRCRRPGRCR
jgi:1-acyl-sn-glycerol-3-phosphate acyltransferase